MSRRQREGVDPRGNSQNRRARKMWMLNHFGDGHTVVCVHKCGAVLTVETVQADRIIPGGSYRRENVQPSCGPCNRARGADRCWGCPLLRLCGDPKRFRKLVAA